MVYLTHLTSHISHLSGLTSTGPPQPVNLCYVLVLLFSNCKVRPRYLSHHLPAAARQVLPRANINLDNSNT